MVGTARKPIVLKEYKTNIYQRLLGRGLAAANLHLADCWQAADYLVIDFKQDDWQKLNCEASKVFCLNATRHLLERFLEEKQPRQVMGFVDFISGLEFIYFWFTQLLTRPEAKELVLEEFFPHQWEQGSACLGLVNSLPTWSIALLPTHLPLVLTRVVPYVAPENFEMNLEEIKASLHIEQDFLVAAPHLQPVQRIFWLENIGIR